MTVCPSVTSITLAVPVTSIFVETHHESMFEIFLITAGLLTKVSENQKTMYQIPQFFNMSSFWTLKLKLLVIISFEPCSLQGTLTLGSSKPDLPFIYLG